MPIALTIAGSDSGGGAGIQADLKTFDRLGVHGVSAVTCITAQNPKRILGIQACTATMVRRQLEAIFEEMAPAAAKTGMLYSSALVGVVARFFERHPTPLVIDPVMVSSSGTRLLQPGAVDHLKSELFPLATLLTPNVSEAEILAKSRIRSMEDLREAANKLSSEFGCAVLVKGGHMRGIRAASDIFRSDSRELLLRARFVRGIATHGTGCALSAAITAYLARGWSLRSSVVAAKQYITQSIRGSRRITKHYVLGASRIRS